MVFSVKPEIDILRSDHLWKLELETPMLSNEDLKHLCYLMKSTMTIDFVPTNDFLLKRSPESISMSINFSSLFRFCVHQFGKLIACVM